MKQAFGLVRRPWGVFYLKNKITGEQKSLKTSDRHEAHRLLQAHNESESQPQFNLSLARVYLNGADPKLGTRTWQEVMENIVAKKTDETRRRWEVAIKDKNFDCIRNLAVAETRPEHFDRALADGKVSTNVYLRPGDRATEFKQRCDGLGIRGVSLHSYRYAWAERALKCG